MSTQTFQSIEPSDIQELVFNHGTAIIGGTEVTLTHPSPSDPDLQSIVKQGTFAVKRIGGSEGSEATFEITGSGKTVKIKIAA